jgi:rubrerythrin
MSNTDNEVRTEQDIINEAVAEEFAALKVYKKMKELEQEAAKIQEELHELRDEQEGHSFFVPKWQQTLQEKIHKAIQEKNDELN